MTGGALVGPAPFLLGPEHEAFAESVRRFARTELADGYLERATSQELPWDLVRRLGREGLLGMSLPEQAGGQGADPLSVGLAVEQLAHADINLAYLTFCSETAVAAYDGLPPEVGAPLARAVAAGEQLLATALTEPGGGSDTAAMRLRAVPVAGGHLLRGEKTSVTGAVHSRHAITAASTDPGSGPQAIRRFLVDLADPTVTVARIRDPGFHPVGRGTITFADTFVPASHEMRDTGSGLSAQLALLDRLRVLAGLMALGAARRAIDITVDWVRHREAFGAPIARYQGVSFPLAEHLTHVEAARMLAYRALGLLTADRRITREAAMIKWWAPQIAVATINDCIVLNGHVGWSAEMPLQQLLTDVSGLQIGDGTPQIQKLLIARDLIGREYVG